MSVKNQVLCEVFDCELDELSTVISENRDSAIMHIKQAMDIYSTRLAWDMWLDNAVQRVDILNEERKPGDTFVHMVNLLEERVKFKAWKDKHDITTI